MKIDPHAFVAEKYDGTPFASARSLGNSRSIHRFINTYLAQRLAQRLRQVIHLCRVVRPTDTALSLMP